ncbi:TITAN-like protein [Euphorbia peplus]|nr:TITAN-like protein [Euphorbia peplus]
MKSQSKKKKRSEFEFCKICNLNHDHGKSHKYFPNHKKSLSAFLSRFRTKLLDIVFFLKNPSFLRSEHAPRNRFWCVFCDTDVDETGSSYACANAILHLESDVHLKNLKHFFWKYGGETKNMDAFRILEADVAKWEKKCKSLENESGSLGGGSHVQLAGPSNDIQNELGHKNINSFENINYEPNKSNCSNGVMPLQFHTNEYQIFNSGLPTEANIGKCPLTGSSLPIGACSGTSLSNSYDVAGHLNSPEPPLNSTLLSCSNLSDRTVFLGRGTISGASTSQSSQQTMQKITMPPEGAGGNVHTGAPPPWFEATEACQLNVQLKPVLSSISKKSGKKLNPKRVGAAWAERRKIELEMEERGEVPKSDFDADWLPNFGRVWQSGSRRESRKEYEKEKQKPIKVESQPEMAISVQPYISKRMRRDAMQGDGG